MDSKTKITQALLGEFLLLKPREQISFLKATPRSINVLQKIPEKERQIILNVFKPKELMGYFTKQSNDCEQHTRYDVEQFILATLKGIFCSASDLYMNEIVAYIVKYYSPIRTVLLLPEKNIVQVVKKTIEKLPVYTSKDIDRVCDDNNFDDVNLQMDEIENMQTDAGSWLINLFLNIDQQLKFDLLDKITQQEMQRFFRMMWIHTFSVVGGNNSFEEMPGYIILCSSSIDTLESDVMDDFLSKILPKWSDSKLIYFFNYIESRSQFKYQGHVSYMQTIIETVVQKLPLTRVAELLKKDEHLGRFLSKEQEFDLKVVDSDIVLDLKYSIVNLNRTPDISGLTKKESFHLLTALV